MRERLRAGRGPGGRYDDSPGQRPAGDWSYIDVTAIRLLAGGGAPLTDLTASGTFIAPDDGNKADQTVLSVPLPGAVAPGQSVTVEVAWTARVPRTFARTGAVGNYFFIAQWFPKLGVLEDTGWNTHQFHAGTEFYADYGVYDVRITVPRGWVVGATGRERERHDTPKGTTTHRYVQEDVHDFVWTTSPDYVVKTATFEHPTLAAHRAAAAAAARASRAGRPAFRGDADGAEVLRRVVRTVSVRPPHDRRSGLAEQRRRHGVPDAVHGGHALAGAGSRSGIPKTSPSTRPATSSGTAWWATTSSSTRGWTKGSTSSRPRARSTKRTRRSISTSGSSTASSPGCSAKRR